MKKALPIVLAVLVIGYFVVMNINPTCSFNAKLSDSYTWTQATYEVVSGEDIELEITVGEDNKVKIKGPNEEMKAYITFKDDKSHTAVYEYAIADDGADEGLKASLEPYTAEE